MELKFAGKKRIFKITIKLVLVIYCVLISTNLSSQKTILKTPLMGWASWNNFGVKISESIIKGQVDGMVSSGLIVYGYNYINIDDGFFDGRYDDGTLRVDSVKFPHGMKALADYIHSKGLKAGIYSEAGLNTCGSVYNNQAGGVGAGMLHHEQQDIDLFFKTWGYDFLKVDFCSGKEQFLDEKTLYSAIKAAIDNTGRTDISYNICRWQFPGTWVTTLANSWRISEDITASWQSVLNAIDKNAYLSPFVSQGHFNDMDMLEIGRGLTSEEDKSYFSMWCILSSPLILGNDLTNITRHTKEILTNSEVIEVDQDTTGVQAHLIYENDAGLQIWTKNLHGKQSKERAVVLFNRSSKTATMALKWKDLHLTGTVSFRDLWLHKDTVSKDSMFTTTVPSHGVVMLKILGSHSVLQEVFEAEYAWINNFNLTQNSVILADQGRVVKDTTCSGNAKVSSLGKSADNYIEFRDIYSNNSGSYHLTISYLSGENRSAVLSINGKDTILTNLNSGSSEIVKNNTVPVELNKGYNTIRISNMTERLPDIDKIQLNLNPVAYESKTLKLLRKIQKLLKAK